MQIATDVGLTPSQVGAVLVLRAGPTFDVSALPRLIGERIAAVPRLRQRLIRTPLGGGRPIWVDDPDFDVEGHLRTVACPSPGDEQALLTAAADAVTTPLPPSRPLWSLTLVTGLAGARVAIVIVFHHVLADGIGGLAVLRHLVDGAPAPRPAPFPRASPSRAALTREALAGRLLAVARLPARLRRLRHGMAEIGPSAHTLLPHTSLNRPTGPRLRLAVARAGLAPVRDLAHACGATVNDVVLTAVTGALHTLLDARGEHLATVVVSVPVSARATTTSSRLGNEVGVILVSLPLTGRAGDRLSRIAAITRVRKAPTRGSSASMLAPAFRALAALGVLRWFIDHQRRISTYVTDLRGPAEPLTFAAAPVEDVIAVTTVTGNVTVAFAALSYAGELTVTVVADPDRCPDLPVLAAALQAELDTLTRRAMALVGEAERHPTCRAPVADRHIVEGSP
jgi:diacylglycerol O-acyltransferase